MLPTMDYSGRRVVVTGGAGFVGGYLVEQLVKAGARVRVADDFSRGRSENLAAVLSDVEMFPCDLRDEAHAQRACKNQEVVFNLAANVAGVEYNRTHHGEMLETNFRLASNVLQAARHCDVANFLVVSSACVYRDAPTVPTPESEGELDSPESANQGYGWAKRMAEKLGQYFAAEYGMSVAIVRPFNAYGPRERFEGTSSHVIPSLIRRVLAGENPLVVWGSGRQTRSFIHASDLAEAMHRVVASRHDGLPVNVGSSREVTVAELVQLVCDACRMNPTVVFDTSRPEGHLRRVPDTSRLQELTGWVPQTTLEDGLPETVAAMKSFLTSLPQDDGLGGVERF